MGRSVDDLPSDDVCTVPVYAIANVYHKAHASSVTPLPDRCCSSCCCYSLKGNRQAGRQAAETQRRSFQGMVCSAWVNTVGNDGARRLVVGAIGAERHTALACPLLSQSACMPARSRRKYTRQTGSKHQSFHLPAASAPPAPLHRAHTAPCGAPPLATRVRWRAPSTCRTVTVVGGTACLWRGNIF